MKKLKAFTLAEVLITLTILGVVAAITVPSLQKQNYNRTQVSRMAKGYASLEKAAANIATATNCIGKNVECTGLFDTTKYTTSKEFQKRFVELSGFRVPKTYEGTNYIATKPLNYQHKSCSSETDVNCHGGRYAVFYTTPDNLAYNVTRETLKTGDNALIITLFTDKFKLYDENGKIISWTSGRNEAVEGRDVFHFIIYKNFQVVPAYIGWGTSWYGYDGIYGKYCSGTTCNYTGDNCNPDDTSSAWTNGKNCTVRIIHDGWKMKY